VFGFFFSFSEVGVRDDVSDRLRSLVVALPPENFTTLKYLMEFLAKVGAHHEKNYMNNKWVHVLPSCHQQYTV
jgi:hypothetical protein